MQIVPSDGGVAVVNQLGLDEYLRGLSEIPTTWPAEALQAQVIAARTYALYGVVSGTKNAVHALGADICATDSCQVYRGMAREQDGHADAWNAAVAATSGQVLLYRGGVIFAEYSSSNGGQSVSGGVPWLPSVQDPDDATSPLHHWRVSVPFADLSRVFSTPAPVTGASRQGDSVVLTWPQPDGSQGSSALAVADFRVRLNTQQPAPAGMPETVPSGRFTVVVDGPGSSVVLEGGGWGHGVGMSQYGAMGKALRGMRAADILASYYGGLRPVTLTPAQLPSSIRVALDLGRPEAVVGGGRFRVLDGAGHVVAVAAHGGWSVVPGPKGGTVRVVPPPDQAGPPALALTTVEPGPTVAPGAPLRLGLQLSAPALVRVVATPPGGATTVADLGLLEAGPVALPLAAASGLGTYGVRVEADAGGGRKAVLPVAIGVADPSAQAPARGGGGRGRVEGSGDSPVTAGVALGRSPATAPVSRPPMWLLELASCAVVVTAAGVSRAFRRRHQPRVSPSQ
jgi:stage II sporulation protein D